MAVSSQRSCSSLFPLPALVVEIISVRLFVCIVVLWGVKGWNGLRGWQVAALSCHCS